MNIATPSLTALLETHFGYKTFRPLQEEIIHHVLSGQDCLVLMPTGGGKSLCYQLPALALDGMTLVVSPLISLMKDQVDTLRENGIAAAFLNSSLSAEEQERVVRDCKANDIRILYIAPERLAVPSFRQLLEALPLKLIAIDEAHCISQWGHDFRPEYRNLKTLREQFPSLPIIALTATATERVRDDILSQLRLRTPKTFLSSFNRENLSYHVRPKRRSFEALLSLLQEHKGSSAILYCFSRNDTEKLAADLRGEGFAALPYHAGLDPTVRRETQEKFIRDDVQIIAATIAFGMGIDKPDVRLVVHMDLPKTIESYYQETGRAGRDGLKSDCVLFYSRGDRRKHDYFIEKIQDEHERRHAQEKLGHVLDFCDLERCRRRFLLEYFGEEWPTDNCAGCDVCTQPRTQVDVTEIAQKILSAVIKTGERYGGQYVLSVLLGKDDEKIQSRGHQSLSVHGIVTDHTEPELRTIMQRLVQHGLLERETGQYPVLHVTDKGKRWLVERQTLQFSVRTAQNEPRRGRAQERDATFDQDLFGQLRALRKELAEQRNVPPFVIFGDVSLQEMCRHFPQTLDSFARITGVGSAKLAQFGELFVASIKRYAEEKGIVDQTPASSRQRTRRSVKRPGSTYDETKQLVLQQLSLSEIARARALAKGTIIQHLELLVEQDDTLDIAHLEPPVQDMKDLCDAFSRFGTPALKPVFDHFEGRFTYDDLRLARLFLQRDVITG